MPSVVGYQPTLADEMGSQERITSTRGHSITSMQAITSPLTTSPTRLHTRRLHLDATTVLSRPISRRHHPAVDPLDSTTHPRCVHIGQEHYDVAGEPSGSCSVTTSSSRSSPSRIDKLPKRTDPRRPRPSYQRFCRRTPSLPSSSPALKVRSCDRRDHRGVQAPRRW